MRLINPEFAFSEAASDEHTLVFRGTRGERFRVTVLEHDIIRVQHFPQGQPCLARTWLIVGSSGCIPLEGRDRDDLTPFSLPTYECKIAYRNIQVHTDKLVLDIHPGNLCIQWATPEGERFASDTRVRAYTYDGSGKTLFHYMQRRCAEHYYGFGEKAGTLDKAGMRMRMENVDACQYNAQLTDPLYKHFPFYIAFVADRDIAYGLLYDNLADCVFDMGKEVNGLRGVPYRYYQVNGGDLDYYLIYGPTIEEVVEKLTALTGRPCLPPKWSLGYLGSALAYTEADNAQEQLQEFARLCDEHDVPCTMFHLSSGYTTDQDGNRNVFTWNRRKIRDPQLVTRNFHQSGMRVAANVKPYLLKTHPQFEECANRGYFVRSSDGEEPALDRFWSGGWFEYGDGAYVDFTNPASFNWWKRQLKEKLFDYGVDAVWNDNNEFEISDDLAKCNGFGEELTAQYCKPLQTLLMTKASYEATHEYKPNERPFVLTRAGCPGIQRYAQTWSGDNATSWHTLRYNIPMGLGLGLSGVPNTGHDVGGFCGCAPSAELFVRWVQNGIFHPRFAIHSSNADEVVNEPWMYPEVLPIVREYIKFRYRLTPYLYALFYEAAQKGHPIIRPLVYHFPRDPRCRTESFDFMLGPNLLVASVLEPGMRERSVYLPAGADWYDFHTGSFYAGGQEIVVSAPLECIPLFVPEGGMVPTGRGRHPTKVGDDLRRVYVFPHAEYGSGTFALYEDDGISMDYKQGKYAVVALSIFATPERISLQAELDKHDYPLPYAHIEFVLPPNEERAIDQNESSQAYQDACGRRCLRIALG